MSAFIGQFQKQVLESYPIAIEYVNRLPSGTSLASAAVAAYQLPDGTLDNTVTSSTTGTVSGTQVKIRVQAGTHGKDYKLTVLATLSDGSILEDDVLMQVRNC